MTTARASRMPIYSRNRFAARPVTFTPVSSTQNTQTFPRPYICDAFHVVFFISCRREPWLLFINKVYTKFIALIKNGSTEITQTTQKLTKTPSYLDQLSIKCRKTKTKVITRTNHNRSKKHNGPITIRRKYLSPAPSAGKRMRVRHDIGSGLACH